MGVRRRILGSSCYPAFYRGHERIGSNTYWHMMRLRKIWAEGSFSVLKREHCLSKIRKRGIPAVTEECLLSAMALNLKRMVRAILLASHMLKIRAESLYFQLGFFFVNRSLIYQYELTQEYYRVISETTTYANGMGCPNEQSAGFVLSKIG